MPESEVLTRLRSRLARERGARDAILDKYDGASVDTRLSTADDAEFRSRTAAIGQLEARIGELEEDEKRLEQIAPHLRRVAHVTRESRTYERGNGRSYLQDLMRIRLDMDGAGESRGRLQRHAQEVDVEFRDLNRTDGTGGYAVPPLWLMDQFVTLARPGRAFANLAQPQDLPAGTDNINVPKIATGTTAAIQAGDNAAVSETDLTDTVVTAPVKTIAGQQDVAIQLLDQSPVSFDEVIFRDLIADYATKVDLQVISGAGGANEVVGIRNTASIETVAYTDASPTVAELYPKLADAVQRVHTLRFMPPTAIVMHPRRWGWLLAALDGQSRPLVLPAANNPQNAVGVLSNVAAEQVVGQMHGLPVVTDPNIPITLGAGTNEDRIYVVRADDLVLYESSIRTRMLPETLSGNLTVRLQVYGYIAFTAARYPKSIVELAGTGLATPTFV